MALVCQVIFQNHVIKELCDFMGKSQSRWGTIMSSLVFIAFLIVEL